MLTAAGGKAAGLARWAWQDPENRVQQAIAQVRELAQQATSADELAEIQDAGTMLSRLAGTLEPPAELISAQLSAAGDTILGQILLARGGGWSTAYLHEKRDAHGHWVKGAGGPLNRLGHESSPRMQSERARQLAAARQQRMIAAEVKRQAAQPSAKQAMQASSGAPTGGNMAAQIAAQAKAAAARYDPQHGFNPSVPTNAPPDFQPDLDPAIWEKQHEAFFQQRVAPHVQAKADEVLKQAQIKAQAITADAQKLMDQAEESKSKHDAMLKLATEGSVAIGGGILAYIEAKLGVPDLVAIASSVGPLLVQIIIEWYKRL